MPDQIWIKDLCLILLSCPCVVFGQPLHSKTFRKILSKALFLKQNQESLQLSWPFSWTKKNIFRKEIQNGLALTVRNNKTTMYCNVCQRVFSIGFNKLTKYLYWNSKISLNFTFQRQPVKEHGFFHVINRKPGNKLSGLPY